MNKYMAYTPDGGLYLCAENLSTLIKLCSSHIRYERSYRFNDSYWMLYRGGCPGVRHSTPPFAVIDSNGVRRV